VGKASRIEAEELQQCRISPFLPSAELCEITPEPGEKVTWRQLSDATLGMLRRVDQQGQLPGVDRLLFRTQNARHLSTC